MSDSLMTALWVQSVLVIAQILSIPVLVAVLVAAIIYVFGPVACIVLSVWRIRQRDYGNTGQDDSKANLVPALDIFYSLVICQGALFFVWLVIHYAAIWIVASFCEQCKLTEKWGRMTIVQYLSETRTKCWKDPASIKGRNFINYAVELVGSESQRDYLSGARMLDTFIKLGADVMPLLLPSRPKIQKLIDTLGWRSSDREIRELAARIIAYLAGDIHLSQFPGAIQCISTLLDTNLPYWNNQQGPNHHSPQIESKEDSNVKYGLIFGVKGIEQRRKEGIRNQEGDTQKSELDSSIHDSKRDGWNELILQGLAILERLALDQHNCRDICSTPGLLPKIMAPLYSKMLIKHINASAWADVVNGSLKVVHRLMRAPGRTGRRLRREIASSKQAVSNLEGILDQTNNASLELHIRAIEILTELAFDLHTNLSKETKENIIEKQRQIFLTDDQGKEEESATKFTELKVTAGKALVLLSGRITLPDRKHLCVYREQIQSHCSASHRNA
uniref:Uncharacterized protein n=1 Tax=Avena sativa TaxID=4498 RepID=A0ACD5X8K7_AVESA